MWIKVIGKNVDTISLKNKQCYKTLGISIIFNSMSCFCYVRRAKLIVEKLGIVKKKSRKLQHTIRTYRPGMCDERVGCLYMLVDRKQRISTIW